MATYKTPGVYVEEISTLPPSVAEVATAIPAFIGYTEKAEEESGQPLPGLSIQDSEEKERYVSYKRISSMLEYRHHFGGPPQVKFVAKIENKNTDFTLTDLPAADDSATIDNKKFILYYSLKLFFENGGGPCYIVSIGNYEEQFPSPAHFQGGFDAIALEDEPTMLVFPDAIHLPSDDYRKVCEQALTQCQKLKDRFAIMDVKDGRDDVKEFRKLSLGTDFLKYGAAYTPLLNTLIPYEIKETNVEIVDLELRDSNSYELLLPGADDPSSDSQKIKVKYSGELSNPQLKISKADVSTVFIGVQDDQPAILAITIPSTSDFVTGEVIKSAWDKLTENSDPPKPKDFDLVFPDDPTKVLIGDPLELSTTTEATATVNRTSEFSFHLAESDEVTNFIKIEYTGVQADASTPPVVELSKDITDLNVDNKIDFDTSTEEKLVIKLFDNEQATIDHIPSAWENKFKDDQTGKKGFELTTEGQVALGQINTSETLAFAENIFKLAPTPDGSNYIEIAYSGTVFPSNSQPQAEVIVDSTVNLETSGGIRFSALNSGTPTGRLEITVQNGSFSGENVLTAWEEFTKTDETLKGNFELTPIVKMGTVELPDGETPVESQTIRRFKFSAKLPSEDARALQITYEGTADPGAGPHVTVQKQDGLQGFDFDLTDTPGTLIIKIGSDTKKFDQTLLTEWDLKTNSEDFQLSLARVQALTDDSLGPQKLADVSNISKTMINLSDLHSSSPQDFKYLNSGLYNNIKRALNKKRLTLPASPAIAGIYARVDRIHGVWKAPANVGVSGIKGPSKVITHDEQKDLNVDPVAGKSINVIRSFTGKGTLVWGSRTLAGNDNEWRYIPVRRLFNLIEESIQKATSFAVFEPNDSTTWLKVKAMIDSYLYGLWQQGALAGSAPEQAFFVNVGLGKTMQPQDILEGRMIVEIGVAAVRPAEFIILRFTHKLQES